MNSPFRLRLAACLFCATLSAQPASSGLLADSDNIVGTWKLVSFSGVTANGEAKRLMGDKPTGFLTYTSDGRMSVIITAENRKSLSVPDRIAAPVAERAEAFSTLIAYAGRYTMNDDRITHRVEASAMPNQVGTDQVRTAKLEGEHLILRTPPIVQGGVEIRTELIWERVH